MIIFSLIELLISLIAISCIIAAFAPVISVTTILILTFVHFFFLAQSPHAKRKSEPKKKNAAASSYCTNVQLFSINSAFDSSLRANAKQSSAFSLIELLISLIAISCIIAAFAPVISKKISTGSLGDARISTQCKKFEKDGSKCKLCLIDRCLVCNSGNRPDVAGVCVPRATEPIYVANVGGLKVMQRNIGDDPIIDRSMLEKIGVTVVNTGETCNSSENHPCCWMGNTANQTTCTSSGSYPSCHRTVCDWWAAKKVCESIGWDLPTYELGTEWLEHPRTSFQQLKYPLRGDGPMGINLCYNGSGVNVCSINKTGCIGASAWNDSEKNQCWPNDMWYKETNGNYSLYHYGTNNTINLVNASGANGNRNAAFSARCVQGEYNSCAKKYGILCNECSYNDSNEPTACLSCVKGYHVENGTCVKTPIKVGHSTIVGGLEVMQRNIGDDPIVNVKKLQEAGVTVVHTDETCNSTADHPCCWIGDTVFQTSCTDEHSNYSGCHRTVCDWWAANKVCDSIGWRLPDLDEAKSWRTVKNAVSPLWGKEYYSRSKSLELCSAYINDKSIMNICDANNYNNHAPGASSNATCAHCIHISGANGEFVWYFGGLTSLDEVSYSRVLNAARSVRCVRTVNEKVRNCAIEYGSLCTECNEEKCTKCIDNYILNDEDRCIKYIPKTPTYVYNLDGLQVMQRNIGDDPSIDKRLLENIGIKVVNAGQTCSPSENNPCCWMATETINTSAPCEPTSSYNACKRTVCDSWAAKRACESIGWRLPTVKELNAWRTISDQTSPLTDVVLNNLYLCDYSSNTALLPKCGYTGSATCNGSFNGVNERNRCYVYSYHSLTTPERLEAMGSNFVYYGKSSGYFAKTQANSARCVKGQYNKCVYKFGTSCKACDDNECKYCENPYQYDAINKICYLPTDIFATLSVIKDGTTKNLTIAKYNAGDFPALSTVKLAELGINVVNSGSSCNTNTPCCWKATETGKTQETCTSTTNYSGCTRTLCNKLAGEIACSSQGWRLPTVQEMHYFLSNGEITNEGPIDSGVYDSIYENAKKINFPVGGGNPKEGIELTSQAGTSSCFNYLTANSACEGPHFTITSNITVGGGHWQCIGADESGKMGFGACALTSPLDKVIAGSVRCVSSGGL